MKIHFFWTGDRPQFLDHVISKWKTVYANDEFYFYSPAEMSWLRNRSLFQTCLNNKRGASDIARVEIIYQFGGLYVDCDIWPVRRYPWERHKKMTLSLEKPHSGFRKELIANGIFFAPLPGNPFLHIIINKMAALKFKRFVPFILTGPTLFTATAKEYPDLIDILPWKYFHPLNFDDMKANTELPQNCFGQHFFDSVTHYLESGIPWK